MVPITETISLTEILWVIITLCGVCLHTRAILIYTKGLMQAEYEPRRLVALGHVLNESLRMAVQLIFVILGILALFTPEPASVTDQQVIGSLTAISIALILVASSVSDLAIDRLLRQVMGKYRIETRIIRIVPPTERHRVNKLNLHKGQGQTLYKSQNSYETTETDTETKDSEGEEDF